MFDYNGRRKHVYVLGGVLFLKFFVLKKRRRRRRKRGKEEEDMDKTDLAH